MLMRRTFPELEASLIKKSLETMPSGIGRYNDAKHVWTLDCGSNLPRSYVHFGHCEREKDVYRHLSAEWQYLGIDESTSFTRGIFDMLYSRVRSTVAGVKPLVRLCSNPGNIGHGWHKEFFGIGKEATPHSVSFRPPMREGDKYPPPTRCFIPATIFDNPGLIENDPGYLARLERLPEARRRMYLDGEWGGYAGQYFTEFDPRKHVLPAFPIPIHWKRFRSVDFGYSKPFSCHWYAIDERGHCYAYRELYRTGWRDREQARAIKAASAPNGEAETYEFTVGDPAMAQGASKDTGITTQQIYHEEGINIFPGSNKRVQGWNAVRNWLATDPKTGAPWLTVFDCCPDLARELEEALTDEVNPEDVNTDGSDHAIDDLRYFVMARPSPSDPLKKDEPRDRLDESSKAEWASVDKMRKDAISAGKEGRAVLQGFNEW